MSVSPQQLLPPYDEEMEVSCLASVMVSKDALLRVISILNSDDFYVEAHRLIYDALCELDRKNNPLDLVSLRAQLTEKGTLELAGGIAYVAKLYQSVAVSTNVEYYAKQIKDLSLRRKLIKTSNEIIVNCHDIKIETSDVLDLSEKMVFDVTSKRLSSEISPISEIVQETTQLIEKSISNKGQVNGTPSGYIDLDNLLTGFHSSELIILAARPGVGKTAFALNIISNVVLQSKMPALFFSLEMPSTQIMMRLLAIDAMVPLSKIRTGFLSQDEVRKLYVSADRFSKSQLIMDDTSGISISEIRAKARQIKQKNNSLGIIVIDYLQLIESTSRIERHLQIGEISRGLKILARELECPVLALSQLSRAVESRSGQKPMLSDLRESGSIEQDADVVMFISREEMYNKDTENKGQAVIDVAKQRNGATDEIKLMFWAQYTRFNNLAVNTYEENLQA